MRLNIVVVENEIAFENACEAIINEFYNERRGNGLKELYDYEVAVTEMMNHQNFETIEYCEKHNIPTNVSIEKILPYPDWECAWYNEVGNRYLVA